MAQFTAIITTVPYRFQFVFFPLNHPISLRTKLGSQQLCGLGASSQVLRLCQAAYVRGRRSTYVEVLSCKRGNETKREGWEVFLIDGQAAEGGKGE